MTRSEMSSGSKSRKPSRSSEWLILSVGLAHSGQAMRYLAASAVNRTRQW